MDETEMQRFRPYFIALIIVYITHKFHFIKFQRFVQSLLIMIMCIYMFRTITIYFFRILITFNTTCFVSAIGGVIGVGIGTYCETKDEKSQWGPVIAGLFSACTIYTAELTVPVYASAIIGKK